MIRTSPTHAAEAVVVPLGDAAPCAVFTISNYILMSYGARRTGQSVLTCDRSTCRIDLQKGDYPNCSLILVLSFGFDSRKIRETECEAELPTHRSLPPGTDFPKARSTPAGLFFCAR